jgi:hypothetical protein
MPADEPVHRLGPLPPWPAKVDLVEWLLMSSRERAAHLRRAAAEDVAGMTSEASTERMVRRWDHWASLLGMDSQQRAEQVRSEMAKACAEMRKLSAEDIADEVERQTQRWTRFWDEVAAEAAKRRQPPGG